MEADYKHYQNLFEPQRRTGVAGTPGFSTALFLVEKSGLIVEAYAEAEDTQAWIGKGLQEIEEAAHYREVLIYRLEALKEQLIQSCQSRHTVEQKHWIQTKAVPDRVRSQGKWLPPKAISEFCRERLRGRTHRHFLLQALESSWKRFLPTSYALYLRVDGHHSSGILLDVRGEQIVSFFKPDLSGLDSDRQRDPEAIVDHLSKAQMTRVQGIFVNQEDWDAWSRESNPWKSVLRAYLRRRVRLAPHGLGLRVFLVLITLVFSSKMR